jgi:cyclopropane fatty-acyl-phospholipid synthase-like methyltransferase
MARTRRHRATRDEIARYYTDLTAEYEAYGGEASSWSYGVWESDVRTHQAALLRGHELLLRGIELTPDRRVLDVGCSLGGFAIWCAERFGCQVTGITICDEHVEIATENAAQAGVADRCEFRRMDMDQLELRPESFDVVTNRDSYCYAQHKQRYLREAFRTLAKGGAWSCIDFNVRAGRLSAADASEVEKVLRGFHIPSLLPLSRVLGHARAAGFEDCTAVELGVAVLPGAALIMRRSREPLRLSRRSPQRQIYSPDKTEEANFRGHFEAGMAYSVGLHTGLFEHGVFRARKPSGR